MHHDDRHPNRRVTAPAASRQRARLWGDTDGNLALKGDDGYTLALVALLMIPMMVMVSFAVDLGSWYAQSTKMQRAADSASMAGDVWLPNDTNAASAAQNAAAANGYTIDCATACVKVSDTDYKVTITAPVSRFFSQVFGTPQFNMSRNATARFNKKIPMGSPTNSFGNNMNPATCTAAAPYQNQPSNTSPCGPMPMMWSAINGPYVTYANGDPYATKCTTTNTGQTNKSYCDNSGSPRNSLYRSTGYNYAVDVSSTDVGKPITVEVYDATSTTRDYSYSNDTTADCNGGALPFSTTPYKPASGSPTWGAQQCQTGDTGGTWNPVLNNISTPGDDINELNMQFTLFQNDKSDLTVSYAGIQRNSANNADCQLKVLAGINAATTGYKNAWKTVCTFTPADPGIFPLRIQSSGINGVTDNGDAFNAFSLRATGGAATRLYALDDMSIWSNIPGTSSRFYLAEIGTEHAGKKILLDMFDPGDGSGPNAFTMQVLAPSAGAPAVTPTGGTTIPATNKVSGCKYNSSPSSTKGPATPNTATNCTVTTKNAGSSTGVYNGNWLRIEIQLDPAYSCTTSASSDCWWTIKYDFGSTVGSLPTDRTVWSLTVVGDPVHLVD